MTRVLLMATTAAICAALASCDTTSNYPPEPGQVAPTPIKPKYPIETPPAAAQATSAPTPPAAAAETPPAASPRTTAAQTTPAPEASPPPAVESQPLAPAGAAPSSAPTPAPSPAPAPYTPPAPATYTPPNPPVAVPQTAPSPAEPQPMAEAPRYRTEPARTVTDGRVVAAKGMFRDYAVRKGDHIDAIARDLQTTRKELVDSNRLKAPYRLTPGQHLKVPVEKAYEAQTGDTMAAVAKRFGVSAAELSDLNDLPERARLRAGVLIALPDHYDDHGPTRLPATTVAEAPLRPRATYRPAPPPSSTIVQDGPYVPSAEALAAAAARRSAPPQASASTPSYNSGPSRQAEAPAIPNQAAIVSAGQGRFLWPVRGEIISGFGVTGVGRRNDGLDIRSPGGTIVHAAAGGNVVYAGDQVPGFGNLVLVKHADGWVTAYAHLAAISVQMRETVRQGEEIGQVGATGGVGEAQLHFEIRYASSPADKAKPLDPLLLLPK